MYRKEIAVWEEILREETVTELHRRESVQGGISELAQEVNVTEHSVPCGKDLHSVIQCYFQ